MIFVIYANLLAYDYRLVMFVGSPIFCLNIHYHTTILFEYFESLGADFFEVTTLLFPLLVLFYLVVSTFIYQVQYNYA